MRWRYAIAGSTIESAVELLGPVTDPTETPATITVRFAALRDDVSWVSDPDYPGWREAEEPEAWWLDVAGVATVRVEPTGHLIEVEPRVGADREVLSHLLVDLVVPVCFDLLGHLVLHATAVAVDGLALAFTGPTGAGKSTLALASARRSGAMLADDCLVVQLGQTGWIARASYPGARVRPDVAIEVLGAAPAGPVNTFTGKHRVDQADDDLQFSSADSPLGAVIVLDPRPGPLELAPLSSSGALSALLGNVFHRGPRFRDTARLFDDVAALVQAIPVYSLTQTRDFHQLDEVAGLCVSALTR